MRKVYITKNLIRNERLSELDFELQKRFDFNYEEESLFEICNVDFSRSYANSSPIDIDSLVEILKILKRKELLTFR